MGRSYTCNCRCGDGPPPDGGCCVPSNGRKLLSAVPPSEANDDTVDYSVYFYREPSIPDEGWYYWHWTINGYQAGYDLYLQDFTSPNRYPTCNSFTEAPFINFYINDTEWVDEMTSDKDIGNYYARNCWAVTWASGAVDIYYPRSYWQQETRVRYDPKLEIHQSSNNSEITVRTTSGAVPEWTSYGGYDFIPGYGWARPGYTTCGSEENSQPVAGWGVGPGITWKRWTNPNEHKIYYVVSGICNTFSKGNFKLHAEIDSMDDVDYWWQAWDHTDRDFFTLFENDGFGCCCDNYVLQFGSGVITIPADTRAENCSGCLQMLTYSNYGNRPDGNIFLRGLPNMPAPEFGIKFFENKQDYENHLNGLDLISIYDAVYPVGQKGDSRLENSILRSDLRSLSGIPELTCLDGSTPNYDNDFTYTFGEPPISGFLWEGYEYSIEPSGGDACMQRLMSLGLASKDPTSPYYPESTGILEGTTFIQNQPSSALKYTFYQQTTQLDYAGDYWVSGLYEWDDNYNVTSLDIVENTSGVTNKGIIYITYYGDWSFSLTDNTDCQRLATDNEWIFRWKGGRAYVPYVTNTYTEYTTNSPNWMRSNRKLGFNPILADEPSGFKNLSDLNSITLGNISTNNCSISIADDEKFKYEFAGYRRLNLPDSGTNRFTSPASASIYNYFYCQDLIENWPSWTEEPAARTREQACASCAFEESWKDNTFEEYIMAYEFDLSPKNMLLLVQHQDEVANNLWWTYIENNFKYDPEVYNVVALTKLLLRLDAVPTTLDGNRFPHQQSFPNVEEWFGTYHLVPNNDNLEEYVHLYIVDPCLSARQGNIALSLTGTLEDLDESIGVGYFAANSLTARDPFDGQIKQVGNPCNPCWWCNTDATCSAGERDTVYIAVRGNFSWDDLGEEFTISNPNIDCTSFIYFEGWEVPGIEGIDWSFQGNSLDC